MQLQKLTISKKDSAVTLVDVIRDFSDSDGTFAKCYG